MKKTILSGLIILGSFFMSCSGEDSESTTKCGSVSNLTIEQQSDQINFTIISEDAAYYEVTYGSPDMNPDENSSTERSNTPNGYIPAHFFNIPERRDYVFYARTVCGENEKGKWFGPVPLTPKPFCEKPWDLKISSLGFTWSEYNQYGEKYSNFQVEYGPQGFTVGNGTRATVNRNSFEQFCSSGRPEL